MQHRDEKYKNIFLFIHLPPFDPNLNIFQKLPVHGDEFSGNSHHDNLKSDNK